MMKDLEMPVGKRDGVAVPKQSPRVRIELEFTERVPNSGHAAF
jgi:hypothetical protein